MNTIDFDDDDDDNQTHTPLCHHCGAQWDGDADVTPPLYCDTCAEECARDEAAEYAHDLWNDAR